MRSVCFKTLAGALAVFAGVALAPELASATGFCPLKRTRDGFVALRAHPSPNARLIGRMKREDEILTGLREMGRWVEVTWWRGKDRVDKGYRHIAGNDWVNGKLIRGEC